ncbi:hypothetical protein J2Y55_001113 [Bosea sp. BE125]|uniref:hypothetical protein n=1 Tax=Bosea sp. BE125 TaxID=2817909 RepID=UPI00285ABF38|nr:hypothetical protein [Bosea sp. BE125]MDR6870113.1 hypothetical protein [Bosea sp. BE125]
MGADDKSRFLTQPAPGSRFEFLCECEATVSGDFVPPLWMTAADEAYAALDATEVTAWWNRWRSHLERQDQSFRDLARKRLLERGAPETWVEAAGGLAMIDDIVGDWRLRLMLADQKDATRERRKRISPSKPARDNEYDRRISQDVIYAAEHLTKCAGPKALADWLNTGGIPGAASRLTSDHVARALAARSARVGRWLQACKRAGLDREAVIDLVARTDFELTQQIGMFLRVHDRAPALGFRSLKGAALARAIHARFDLCVGARQLEQKNSELLATA